MHKFYKLAWYGLFVVFPLLFAVGATVAPFVQTYHGYPAGEGLYAAYGHVCHQYPTRSLWVTGRPVALCARCFAGYLGIATAGLLARKTIPYRRRLVLGAFLLGLAVVDPIVQLQSHYISTNPVRVITGLVGGAGLFLIVAPSLKVKAKGD